MSLVNYFDLITKVADLVQIIASDSCTTYLSLRSCNKQLYTTLENKTIKIFLITEFIRRSRSLYRLSKISLKLYIDSPGLLPTILDILISEDKKITEIETVYENERKRIKKFRRQPEPYDPYLLCDFMDTDTVIY